MASQKVRAAAIAALKIKTPAALVAAAKNKKHPLHNDFIWDDRRAAHKQRIERAREIFASVRVVITTSKRRISTVAYVRDPRSPPGEQGYVEVAQLRDDIAYAREALDTEIERIKSMLERAREFADTVGLGDELEKALISIMRLHSRSRRGPAGIHILEAAE